MAVLRLMVIVSADDISPPPGADDALRYAVIARCSRADIAGVEPPA